MLLHLKHQLRSSCSSITEHQRLHKLKDMNIRIQVKYSEVDHHRKRVFCFLHFPPPKIWCRGFCRPNSRLKREFTELVPSSKYEDAFCLEKLSATVSTKLLMRFSLILSAISVIFTRNKNHCHRENENAKQQQFNITKN